MFTLYVRGHPEAQNAPEPAREAQNGVDSRSGILETPKELVEVRFRSETQPERRGSAPGYEKFLSLSLVIVPSLRSQADVLLRTPRLILSPVDFTDAGSVLALMEHPLVRNELEVELASPTRESLQQLPYYAARRLTDRQIIGGLGLHDDLVSFFVAPEYWGKGLGFEMVQHACRILAPAATWQSNSGSKVIARRLESCTPDPTAIPWLLLETVSSKGPGIFHRVTYIQRVNTTGGLAPTDPGSPFAEEHVPYTAEYYFYRATH